MAYSLKDARIYLQPYLTQYGGGTFGTSFRDQYRNAGAGLAELKNMEFDNPNDKERLQKELRGMKGNAVIGGAASALSGLAGTFSDALSASRVTDTSGLYNQLGDAADQGIYGYGSMDSIFSDPFEQASVDMSKEDMRGMNTMQKVTSIGTSALNGFTTGTAIAGPWGGLAGAAIAGGITAGGVLAGNNANDVQYKGLQIQAQRANAFRNENRIAAIDQYEDQSNRSKIANMGAKGGQMERRSQSLREFADAVLNNRERNERTRALGLERTHGEGGTRLRIKIK